MKRASQKAAGGPRRRVSKNQFTTKSGKTIKIPRTLTQRWVNRRDAKQQRRAERLATLPKNRFKRFLYHFQPKRMWHYWTSRDGGIMALKIIGIGAVLGFVLLVGLFAYFRKDLPNLRDISGDNIGGSTRYYDRSGKTLLWEDYDAVKRIPVQDSEIAQDMKDATIAIEDKDFFHHGGFDVRGIVRAGWNNTFGNGGTQGGSTITQQLVKLSNDWTRDQSYTRKIKEIILAVELERTYSKQEILTGYLNTAPYGGIEYGVEAAARDYFNKSAKDLSLAEAAYLASIPKSPHIYYKFSPAFDKAAAVGRSHYILDLMKDQGMITEEERDKAKGVDVIANVKPRKPKYDGIKAPWFVLAAKNQLENQLFAEVPLRGGWKVITSVDLDLQKIAEEQVANGIGQVRAQGGDNAAFAAEDVETGQMVALVGGNDFRNKEYGEINYAQTPLPPGSSYKPYDYLALMETKTNAGAGSVLYDTQGPLEGYPCTQKGLPPPRGTGNCLFDYDFRYPGPVTIRYALGGSRNVPAVKAMLIAGIDNTIGISDKLMDPLPKNTDNNGFGYKCFYDEKLENAAPCYASSAIGDGAYLHLDQHVHGYGTISRIGENIDQTYILKVLDSKDDPRFEWKKEKGEQVIRKDAAYIMADIMSDPNASYFPAGRKPHRHGNWKFAMKTGTTNDAKDGWMMGFSTKYAAGVWVGHHTRRVEMSGFMESMTQPIWEGWMRAAHDRVKDAKDWQKPDSVQTLPAFVIRSHVGLGSVEPSPANDLFPSWYKKENASSKEQTIDKVSKKLATECTPDLAKQKVNNANANSFSADTYVTGGVTTKEKDDVHKCDDARPTVTDLSISNDIVSVRVYRGTHPLSSGQFPGTVNFLVNGQVKKSVNVTSDGQKVTYNASSLPSGSKVTAEVIDSVLYSGKTSGSVTTQGSASASITLDVDDLFGNTYQFDWNTIGSASSYEVCVSSSSMGEECEDANPGYTREVSGNNKKAYVRSNNGIKSKIVSFY